MSKAPAKVPIETPEPTPRPALIVYDDAIARGFEPFALTRPIGTLVTGTGVVWERWQSALQLGCRGIIAAAHLAEFDEAPGVVNGTLPAGTVIANSRFAPALEMLFMREASAAPPANHEHADARAGSWTCGARVAAVRLTRAMPVAHFADGSVTLESLVVDAQASAPIAGWWHDEVWDFVKHLPAMLVDDIGRMITNPLMKDRLNDDWGVPSHATVLGTHRVLVWGNSKPDKLPPAVIEPHVVFDATAGPILVETGAHIHAFTRINGPCRIGANATIMGGDITGCSIGPVSKVRGEISGSIVLGYSNKGHEGFVGNSYLGRWVNLGAGTTTSNLKNTYGEVSLWTPSGVRRTGMQFLGTLFGDHVKTGIGTRLTTGTVLGAAANVFGSAMPPKAVAPFS